MNKILVFAVLLGVMLSVTGVFAGGTFDQTFQGDIVTIEVSPSSLDFVYLASGSPPFGPTSAKGTTFIVTPSGATGALELAVTDIEDTITGSTIIEYNTVDTTEGWKQEADFVSVDNRINLDNDAPTLWVRLNSIDGAGVISGTITYTIMTKFDP